jgi:hypothetical protein
MAQDEKVKLPVTAHLICGWPLALVAVGGAIGGGLGGAAYAVNLAVYKSTAPPAVKILLNVLIGGAAIVIWLMAAAAIQKALS